MKIIINQNKSRGYIFKIRIQSRSICYGAFCLHFVVYFMKKANICRVRITYSENFQSLELENSIFLFSVGAAGR